MAKTATMSGGVSGGAVQGKAGAKAPAKNGGKGGIRVDKAASANAAVAPEPVANLRAATEQADAETEEADEEDDEELEAVKPLGLREFILWYMPLQKAGKTTAEMVEAYPGGIKSASFSAKLAKNRKDAKEKLGLVLPSPVRGRNRGLVNGKDLGRELAEQFNLEYLFAEESEEEDAEKEAAAV